MLTIKTAGGVNKNVRPPPRSPGRGGANTRGLRASGEEKGLLGKQGQQFF